MSAPTAIAYLGPPGQGLGFRLAGVEVQECLTPADALAKLTQYVHSQTYAIIFLDETLAATHLEEIGKLNEQTLPSIMLLPTSLHSQKVAAAGLQRLIIKAVGSDIFNT